MLRSSLGDYEIILVSATITVPNAATAGANQNNLKI